MVKHPKRIMSEFFLELFSEEIPSSLQKSARKALLENFIKLFQGRNISFKSKFQALLRIFFLTNKPS